MKIDHVLSVRVVPRASVLRYLAVGFLAATGCTGDPDGELCEGAGLGSDPLDCGECTDGACEPVTLASGQNKPNGIFVDDRRIVWTTEGVAGSASGTIATCPLDGCPNEPTVVYRDLGRPSNPIVIGEQIYFVHGVGRNDSGFVGSFVPEVGSFAGEPLGAPLMWWGSGWDVTSLAIADSQLYFGTKETVQGAKNALVAMCPTSGCPNNGVDLYLLADLRAGISTVIVDATHTFFVDYGAATIASSTRQTGAVTDLFTGELGALVLAQDTTHLYWGTSVPPQQGLTVKNYLARGAKTGGTKEKLAEVDEVSAIAVAGDWVYFAEATGDVARVKKTGGAVETLATGQKVPRSLVVAGEYLYWVNYGGDTVHRLHLPRSEDAGQ